MPLFGKIVIIKRNGTDGTEFPLTTACLFGRKLDCDIRIQIPQVSKEQCRIEQNENKELILTNLSSVNPTRVNGVIVQQSERLKHGDLITIIDRSFRFECPPPPTPKKERLSTNENGEAVKVLQDQQVSSSAPTDKKKIEHTFDSCLKDGSNLSPALDQSVEVVKGDGSQPIKPSSDGSKSPFYELYNMVKQDLATRSPRRATAPPSTPLSRPQLNGKEPGKALDAGAAVLDKNDVPVTPKQGKKKRRSSVTRATSGGEGVPPLSSVVVHPAEDSTTKPRRSSLGPATPVPLEGNTSLVSLKNISETPKGEGTGVSRPQSQAATPERPPALPSTPRPRAAEVDQTQMLPTGAGEPEPKQASRTSPRANAGKRFQIQDMLREFGTTAVSEEKGDVQTSRRKHKMADLPIPVSKRKRVSFGGQLSPELFDKRLPPNSPLRRGATPGRRSLSVSQKPQSLLRRASTIGLMSFRLDKAVPENPAKSVSPKRASSPGKTAKVTSQTKASSPAKKAPSPKARTPSPKGKKSPSRTPTPSSGPAMPKTPNSTRRSSDAPVKTSSKGSLIQTPATQGRFSVSRVSTPSPISDQEVEAKGEAMCVSAVPDACMTPSLSLRRTSMKASARKTPKSALKSVFDVMRSRRSGASRANLKVISSWADIVKFGQVKVQTEAASKKSMPKRKASKQTKVTQTQTPVRRLKDNTSTGHADSPATVVIGKAYTRSTQLAGAAPKVVSNVALFAKDRKMNEDFTGVAEIFKTPSNSKGKGVVGRVSEYPETPLGVSFSTVTEISMMSTPEESGVMMVSPMSITSTAKLGRYNSEAVSRLLQDNQDASLIQQDGPSQTNGSNDLSAPEVISALEMTVEDQTEAEPQTVVQTPQQKPAPSGCLTGVKKLMTTPKHRAEPIEDLRGRLLRTPKEPKAPLEESLEGVKELLTTPKQKGTHLEEMTGLNILQKTPKVKSSPVVCAAGLSRLIKTPKDKTEKEEDLTGVKQLMRTPKSKGEPVEKEFGLKRLMKTPKQKNKPVVEDLTGIRQMMKTPKQKNKPVVEDLTGIRQMMKTPKQKNKPVVEDLTGIRQMMKTPKQKDKPVVEDLTGIQQMMKTPKQRRAEAVENFTEPAELNQPKSTSVMTETEHDLSASAKIEEPLVSVASGALDVNRGDQECEDEENVCPPEDTRRESEAAVAIQDVSQIETEKGAETTPRIKDGHSDKKNEVETSSCEEEGSVREPPVEAECTSQAGDATPSLVALKQVGRSHNVNKTPRSTRAKAAQKPQQCGHADAVSGKYEHASVSATETAPAPRGKGGERAVKLLESTPVSTPARKSSRGRIPKRHFEETQVTVVLKSTQESADGEKDSECPPAAKGRRGRNAKRDVEVAPVLEVKVAADLTTAEPAEAGASGKLPVPVAKGKRGQRAKEESENSPLTPTTQEPQGLNVPEAVVVEADMAPEGGELQTLAEPNAKPRRGRRTKKEQLKAADGEETTKSTPASVEADSSDVAVSGHAQTSAVKPGRGRRAKPGALMDQVATAEPEEDAELVAADPVAVVQPPARSSRGTKTRALKTQSDDQHEPSTMFAEPGQNAEATVKNTRGGRRAKQPKARSLEDALEETKGNPRVECETVAQMEAPTIKSGRGQRVAAARDDMGGPVKRGRHAAAIAKVSPPVAKSTRARKTAVKTEDAPVPKETVRETITSVPEVGPGGAEDTRSIVVEKKRRGRTAKKAKVSSEDDPVMEAEELITAKESENRKTTKKNVNWNSDLVCWRNIEEVEPPGAKEERKQTSRKKAVPVATAVESTASETKRPEDPTAYSRRGRGARRLEEPAVKQSAEEDAPRVRRGRAPASKPDDDVARVKRGHNRKATEAAADDLPIVEPSPGTKAGNTGAGVPGRTRRGAAAKQVAEAPEAEAEQRQPVAHAKASKPARGRRKAPQDGGAHVPASEVTPRRVQKPADRAESAAPLKRTRRK